MRRIVIVVVGAVALAGLFLALRPESDTEVPAPVPAETGAPTPVSGGTTGTAVPNPDVIDVSVTSGEVSGPGEASVGAGTSVVIRVSADVADEVHLHGYDLHAGVAPGQPGELSFVADAPGVFEVELEGAGLLLLSLTVTP